MPEAGPTGAGHADERNRAGLDLGLHRVALRLRERAGRDLGVDLVLLGLLKRARERTRLDPELTRSVGHDRRAGRGRRVVRRRRDRRAAACNGRDGNGNGDELSFQMSLHVGLLEFGGMDAPAFRSGAHNHPEARP